jgi:hypothetical protein
MRDGGECTLRVKTTSLTGDDLGSKGGWEEERFTWSEVSVAWRAWLSSPSNEAQLPPLMGRRLTDM